MKKKRKKKKIVISVICVAVVAAALLMALSPKRLAYDEEAAKKGDITTYYSFNGNIEAKEKQTVMSDKMMQVHTLYVKEGDTVKEGDALLKTSTGEEITSAINGEVSKLYVQENAQLLAGAKVAELVNYDDLQVTVKVDEYDVQALTAGSEVDVTVNALNKEIRGTVEKVSKEAVTTSGVSYFTASVNLERDADLLIGMSTEIRMVNRSVSDAVTIPMKALQFDDYNNPYVYCKGDKGRAVTRSVTVGVNDGTTVQITDGLSAGETVLIPQKDQAVTFRMAGRSDSAASRGN